MKEYADLYRLTVEQLVELERIGEKTAQNVVAEIAESKGQPLDRLLAGLAISHVGNRVAYVLASNFGSLAALEQATVEEIDAIDEIGETIAESVHHFFQSEAGKRAVDDLRSVGVDPKMKVVEKANLPLAGQSICITGTLEHYDRKAIEDLITSLGGKPSGSVSKKTAILIAGEKAGSKLEKAKEAGVKVMSEREFLVSIGRPPA